MSKIDCQCTQCRQQEQGNRKTLTFMYKPLDHNEFARKVFMEKCVNEFNFLHKIIKDQASNTDGDLNMVNRWIKSVSNPTLFWPLVTNLFEEENKPESVGKKDFVTTIFRSALVSKKYGICDQLIRLALENVAYIRKYCPFLETGPISLLWYLLSGAPSVGRNAKTGYKHQEYTSGYFIASKACSDGTVELESVGTINPYLNMQEFLEITTTRKLREAWLEIANKGKLIHRGLNKEALGIVSIYAKEIKRKQIITQMHRVLTEFTKSKITPDELMEAHKFMSCRHTYWRNSLHILLQMIIETKTKVKITGKISEVEIDKLIKKDLTSIREHLLRDRKCEPQEKKQTKSSKARSENIGTLEETMHVLTQIIIEADNGNESQIKLISILAPKIYPSLATIMKKLLEIHLPPKDHQHEADPIFFNQVLYQTEMSLELTKLITNNRSLIPIKLELAKLIKIYKDHKLLFLITNNYNPRFGLRPALQACVNDYELQLQKKHNKRASLTREQSSILQCLIKKTTVVTRNTDSPKSVVPDANGL